MEYYSACHLINGLIDLHEKASLGLIKYVGFP